MRIVFERLQKADRFIVVVLCVAAIYWLFALSPSSYGQVLINFEFEETGLILGEPRDIRSDEFAIWTPQIQIAVNNNFQRFNETSPYHEDLRTPYSIPLLDWGLAFKPQFWLFMVADPAYAYSFYHVIHAVAFLLGYYLLFQRFAFRRSWAGLASLTLFFSSFMQFWWASLGQHPSILPWILLCFLSSLSALKKIFLLAFLFTTWMLSAQFYPPYILSLGLTGALAVIVYRPEALNRRSMGIVSGAAMIAVALASFYYWDALPRLMASENHGGRILMGGQTVTLSWLAQFFPFLALDGFNTLSAHNICEGSTLGSYALLLGCCLLDLEKTRNHFSAAPDSSRELRRAALGFLLPFTWISIWMLAPVPSWAGMPLLWHLFPSNRLFFAAGLLLCLFTLSALRTCQFSWTPGRLILFTFLTTGEQIVSELWLGGRQPAAQDLVPLLPLTLILLKPATNVKIGTLVLAVAAAANIAAFAPFNPVQSSKPIFHHGESARTLELSRLAKENPRGWVAIGGGEHYGSVINGFGIPSIGHAHILPEVDFYREFFPELEEEELMSIFNRYSIVQVSERVPWNVSEVIEKPRVVGTAILVPPGPFLNLKSSPEN